MIIKKIIKAQEQEADLHASKILLEHGHESSIIMRLQNRINYLKKTHIIKPANGTSYYEQIAYLSKFLNDHKIIIS